MIQQVGIASFSYGDLAKRLGISSPSIHHHFPTKADLVTGVAVRYREAFVAQVAAIDEATVHDRVAAYANLFDQTAAAGLLCLCGAIAAEWPDVSDEARREVREFFAEQHRWLSAEIMRGIDSGEFRADVDTSVTAQTFLAALEGSMLISRPIEDASLATSVADGLLRLLKPTGAGR